MPSYPITLTISNIHSKIPVSVKVQGVYYPVALATKSVEDLFNVDEVLTITVTVE